MIANVDEECHKRHSFIGVMVFKEYRLFIVDGAVLAAFPPWEAAYDADEDLPFDPFIALAQHVQSRFFTMDIAQTIDGSWLIVELGDGQVAGLPDQADVGAFYRRLKRWADRSSVRAEERTDRRPCAE